MFSLRQSFIDFIGSYKLLSKYGEIQWTQDHYEVIKHDYLKFLFKYFPQMSFNDLMDALSFGDSNSNTGYYGDCNIELDVDIEALEKFLVSKGYL